MADRLENLVRDLLRRLDEEKRLADKRAKQLYLADKCARAYLGTNQLNIADLTWTKVLLDTETYDPGGNFSTINSRFYAPVSGYYQVNGSVQWGMVVADKRYCAAIAVNGASVAVGDSISSGVWLSNLNCSLSDIIYVAAGNYIELFGWHDSGASTEDIYATSFRTFLSVHLLSAA